MAKTQTHQSGRPVSTVLVSAAFGTYYGKPEIKITVDSEAGRPTPLLLDVDGIARPWIIGVSARSIPGVTVAPMKKTVYPSGGSSFDGLDISAIDFVDAATGFDRTESTDGDAEAFAKTWNRAVKQYKQHLAAKEI